MIDNPFSVNSNPLPYVVPLSSNLTETFVPLVGVLSTEIPFPASIVAFPTELDRFLIASSSLTSASFKLVAPLMYVAPVFAVYVLPLCPSIVFLVSVSAVILSAEAILSLPMVYTTCPSVSSLDSTVICASSAFFSTTVADFFIAASTPTSFKPSESSLRKLSSLPLAILIEISFVSEIDIPFPPTWSFTKSNVLIYTGSVWLAITSFNAVPFPLASSVNTFSLHVPFTTLPLVTTKSFGISISPITYLPLFCVNVYFFSIEEVPSEVVVEVSVTVLYAFTSERAPSTFVEAISVVASLDTCEDVICALSACTVLSLSFMEVTNLPSSFVSVTPTIGIAVLDTVILPSVSLTDETYLFSSAASVTSSSAIFPSVYFFAPSTDVSPLVLVLGFPLRSLTAFSRASTSTFASDFKFSTSMMVMLLAPLWPSYMIPTNVKMSFFSLLYLARIATPSRSVYVFPLANSLSLDSAAFLLSNTTPFLYRCI